jgi:hypothetical protein
MLNAMKLINSLLTYLILVGVIATAFNPQVYGRWEALADQAYEEAWSNSNLMEFEK